MGCSLPHVVQCTVGTDAKDLEPAIGVTRHRDLRHPASQPVPPAPRTGVWGCLPHVVQCAVGTDAKDLESAIGVAYDVKVGDPAAQPVPPAPGSAAGRGLPHVVKGPALLNVSSGAITRQVWVYPRGTSSIGIKSGKLDSVSYFWTPKSMNLRTHPDTTPDPKNSLKRGEVLTTLHLMTASGVLGPDRGLRTNATEK